MGVGIGAVGTHSDLTHPDGVQRRRELDYLRADIALASQLGARYVRVTDGQAHPGVSVEQGLDWATEGLTEASRVARGLWRAARRRESRLPKCMGL